MKIAFCVILIIAILMVLCFKFCVKRIDDGNVAYKISVFSGQVKTIKSGKLVFVLPFFDELKEFSLKQYELKLPRDYTEETSKDDSIYTGLDEKSWRTQDEFVRLRFKMIFSISIENISNNERLRSSLADKSQDEICEYAYEIARPVIDGYLLTIKGHDARRHPQKWKDNLKQLVESSLLQNGIQLVYFEPYSHKKNDDSVRYEYEEAVEKTRISKEKAVKLAENEAEKDIYKDKIELLETKRLLAAEETAYRLKMIYLDSIEKTAEIEADRSTYDARVELRNKKKELETADLEAKKACIQIDTEAKRIALELEKERLLAYTEAEKNLIQTSGEAASKLKPDVFMGGGNSGFDNLTFSTLKGIEAFRESGVISSDICDRWANKVLGQSSVKMDLNSTGSKLSKSEITNYMIELLVKNENPNPTVKDIENYQMLEDDEIFANTLVDYASRISEYASVEKTKEYIREAVEKMLQKKAFT